MIFSRITAPYPGRKRSFTTCKKRGPLRPGLSGNGPGPGGGEAISWHLKELLALPDPKVRRVTFNEITQNVVTSAIAHPRNIDYDLVDAQQARRILDRIVGYQLSPLLWKKVRRGLSAGRVQSVATRLVVDRENEIRAFCPQGVLVPGCDPGPAGEAWLLCGEVPRGGEKAGAGQRG